MTPRLAWLFRWAMATQQRRPSTSSSAVSRSATRGESLRRHRFNLHYETIAGGLLISLIGMVLRRGFAIREQHGFTIHEQRGCALARGQDSAVQHWRLREVQLCLPSCMCGHYVQSCVSAVLCVRSQRRRVQWSALMSGNDAASASGRPPMPPPTNGLPVIAVKPGRVPGKRAIAAGPESAVIDADPSWDRITFLPIPCPDSHCAPKTQPRLLATLKRVRKREYGKSHLGRSLPPCHRCRSSPRPPAVAPACSPQPQSPRPSR